MARKRSTKTLLSLYDTKKRVTQIQKFPTGKSNAEDTCQRANYTYDANLSGETFSQNVQGRLAAIQYNACVPVSAPYPGFTTPITELYSYHVAGAVTGKRTKLTGWWDDDSGSHNTQPAWMDLSYAYNSAGQVSSVTIPSGIGIYTSQYPLGHTPIFTTSYDNMARPTSLVVSDAEGDFVVNDGINNYSQIRNGAYDLAGRLTSFDMLMTGTSNYSSYCDCVYYTGLGYQTQTQTYNVNGQLASIGWSGTGYGPTGTITYSYSATQNNGQITQMTDSVSGETVVYQYDALKRLTSAASTPNVGSSPSAWTETYGYDGFGNLAFKALNGTNTSIAIDGTTNRLSSASYDANGNMTSGAGGTLGYDEANRMKSFAPVSGGTEYYGYSPANKRVYRVKPDGSQEFTLFGAKGEKLAVYSNAASAITAVKYLAYFAGNLVCEGTCTTIFGTGAVFQDRLGTNRASGARFRPYGDEITSTSQDREKFATYNRDGFSGLDYADQRYFASTYGRFDTADPYKASGGPSSPRSWNQYAYVAGDPINFRDRHGTCYESVEDEYGGNDDFCYSDSGGGGGGGGESGPSQGGGGGGDPTPKSIAGGTADQQQVLKDAYKEALKRLANPDCASVFDPAPPYAEPIATLGNTDYRIISLASNATGAQTNSSTSVFVNSTGPFFNQTQLNPATGQFQLLDFGTGLTGASWGALLLLHELGHETGVFGPDAAGTEGVNAQQNITNTLAVLNHCFTPIGGGLYQ